VPIALAHQHPSERKNNPPITLSSPTQQAPHLNLNHAKTGVVLFQKVENQLGGTKLARKANRSNCLVLCQSSNRI